MQYSYNNQVSYMLQHIISNKVEKSKQNIQTYLTNLPSGQAPPKEKQVSAPPQAPPRPAQQATVPFHPQNNATTPATTNANKSKPIKNEVEVRVINVAGKQFSKEGILFKFNKEQGRFEFHYEDDGCKWKVQGKRQSLGGKRMRTNYTDGSITFEIKQMIYKKQDVKETAIRGVQTWITGKQINQQTVAIWLKDKDQLKALMQTPFFDGLYDPTSTSVYIEPPKFVELMPQQGAEPEEDHTSVKLTLPTAAQQAETQKIRKLIKQMKEEDKTTVLMEIFKIKKEYEDPTSIGKKLKCPVHYCEKKSYKDIQQLKNHLKMKHPELSKHGIQMSEYDGNIEYGSKAMDLALFVGKMYPQEMKKIIKHMKTKQSE